MLSAIKKIIKNPAIIFIFIRLYFIYKRPRFQQGSFRMLEKNFIFVDSASFVSMYMDIFINELYKFKTDKKKPLIVDCGANIGLTVLYFKTLYPNAAVRAFEPDNDIFKTLEANCKKFGIEKNVLLINEGVWIDDKGIDFLSDGSDGGRIVTHTAGKDVNRIKTIRLKAILEKAGEIDLLKIDIEGAELEVLNDCKYSLSRVNLLFVEYHSFANSEQHLDALLNILKEAGFRYYINGTSSSLKNYFLYHTKEEFDLQLNIYAHR